ncbi:DUF5392 family protein [Fredinandcohnia sp. 179-A 10B2 NHS]|uniref:DUF5392 family protein n=1 Tax=Fredinandcohnia sp. 179-A 10B2 NHS TaxID=3235176 RepID=UPI00399F5079
MNIFTTTNLPAFIKKELEQLQEKIGPLMAKTSKYMFWSFPLITISLVNLIFLLFFTPFTNESWPSVIIYATLGAIGFALSKETKFKKKEIETISSEYIINRIKKSDVISEGRQEDYIVKLQNQPKLALHHFIEFLNEEKRKENRGIYS